MEVGERMSHEERMALAGALELEVRTAAAVLHAGHARLTEITERLLATGRWQCHGFRTPGQYLIHTAGLSRAHADQVVRIASRRSEFPMIVESFDAGQLSCDQVAEAVKAPGWADGMIHDLCTISTVSKLRRAMRSSMFEDLPENAPKPKPVSDKVSFGARRGRWRLTADLSIDDGRRVEAALIERKDDLFTSDDKVTWVEAFTDCFDRSIDAVESRSRRDRYRTWLHVDVTDGTATTTDGWRIPQALSDRILCDGTLQPVWESDGVPFSVGRAQHIVPERTRRIVELRDRGCRVPGCTNDRFVEVHHIVHWLDGGPTDTGNLISVCPHHHQLHHQGRLGITGDADQFNSVIFTGPDGEPLDHGPAPPIPGPPSPPPAVPYRSPLIGRFDWRWIGHGWKHPDLRRQRIRPSLQHLVA